MTRRQRSDGTWTTTTEEWDRRWYWTVGTVVHVAGQTGRIVKVNSVTVSVDINGRVYPRVPVDALTRGGVA